jgi:histidine ammonia-lyase
MATHGARRLLTMTTNALHIIAIEFLAACQGIDFRRPLQTSTPLQQAHRALRAHVPFATEDRLLAEDIQAAGKVIGAPSVQALADFLLPSFS